MDDKSGEDTTRPHPIEAIRLNFRADMWVWHTASCWKVQRDHIYYRAFVFSITDWPLDPALAHHCLFSAFAMTEAEAKRIRERAR